MKTRILLTLHALLLFGCGGGDGTIEQENNVTPPPVESGSIAVLSARDTSAAMYVGEATVVDLKSAVAASDGSALLLENVKPKTADERCGNIALGNLNFTVNAQEKGTCVYEYSVTDTQRLTKATAYTYVTVSEQGAALAVATNLAIISKAIEIGEEVTVALTPPAGMTLSSSVTVLGHGSLTNVDTVANTINYQAGSTAADAGITRLIYELSDSEGLVRFGIIDIAVSTDTFNQTPVAQNWRYIDALGVADGDPFSLLKEDQVVTIDVANALLPSGDMGSLISDPDAEDSLQLVAVQTVNANATLTDPENTSSTSFNFSAPIQGRYSVAYTVVDHQGGYAVGLIEFNVQGSWPDVVVNDTGDLFKAPITQDAAVAGDYEIAELFAENAPTDSPPGNGKSNIPAYTWTIANAACRARGGSLPSIDQVVAFAAQEGNPYLEGDGTSFEMASEWPVQRGYFTSSFDIADTNLVNVWDAVTNTFMTVSSGEDGNSEPYHGYLWCVDGTSGTLEIINEELLAGVPQQLEAEITTTAGNVFSYTGTLEWDVQEPKDNSLEAMENINQNVSIDRSGKLLALEGGYINLIARTPSGDLITNKDVFVFDNMLEYNDIDTRWIEDEDNGYGECELQTFSIGRGTYDMSQGMVVVNPRDAQNRTSILRNCSDDLVTPGNQRYMVASFGSAIVSDVDEFDRPFLLIDESYYFPLPVEGTGKYRFVFDLKASNALYMTSRTVFSLTVATNIGTVANPDEVKKRCWIRGDGSRDPLTPSFPNSGTNFSRTDLGDGWYRFSCDIGGMPQGGLTQWDIGLSKDEGSGLTSAGTLYLKNAQFKAVP